MVFLQLSAHFLACLSSELWSNATLAEKPSPTTLRKWHIWFPVILFTFSCLNFWNRTFNTWHMFYLYVIVSWNSMCVKQFFCHKNNPNIPVACGNKHFFPYVMWRLWVGCSFSWFFCVQLGSVRLASISGLKLKKHSLSRKKLFIQERGGIQGWQSQTRKSHVIILISFDSHIFSSSIRQSMSCAQVQSKRVR